MNNIKHVSIDPSQKGIFSNTLNLEHWINTLAWNELNNFGIACIQERKQGNEISEIDKKWMFELIIETVKKRHYQIMNETFEFIPDRLKNARLFSRIKMYY